MLGGILLGLGAGAVSTVNPCGFAMLPPFIAYFLGEDEEAQTSIARRLVRALVVAGLVIAGFLVVFLALGALISLASDAAVRVLPWITLVAGVLILGAGAFVLAGRGLSVDLHPLKQVKGRTSRSMVVYGAGFGLASVGCTLPIFLVVVASALQLEGFVPGLAVFTAYALGMGAVLTGITIATALGKTFLVRRMKQVMPYIQPITGLALMGAGAYLVWRQIAFLRFGGLL